MDKPKGVTSYKVVEKISRKFRIKAGHLGTLDPMATGLLPVCINEALKIVQFLIDKDKEYEGTLLLGKVTDSGDLEGKVLKENKKVKVSPTQIKSVAQKFTGTYSQIPPMRSAIKQNGKRLYQIARKGKEIKRKGREVAIYSLQITPTKKPLIWKFKVVCSKGTYIRSLAEDIGNELGCGAVLTELRRTKVGNFSVEDAKPLEKLLSKENLEQKFLIDIKTALKELPEVKVKNSFLKHTFCGTPIYKVAIFDRNFELNKGLVAKIVSIDGQIVSVAKCIRDEKDLEKLADNGIVFNHIRVFNRNAENPGGMNA